jgi:hypothetical protein
MITVGILGVREEAVALIRDADDAEVGVKEGFGLVGVKVF